MHNDNFSHKENIFHWVSGCLDYCLIVIRWTHGGKEANVYFGGGTPLYEMARWIPTFVLFSSLSICKVLEVLTLHVEILAQSSANCTGMFFSLVSVLLHWGKQRVMKQGNFTKQEREGSLFVSIRLTSLEYKAWCSRINCTISLYIVPFQSSKAFASHQQTTWQLRALHLDSQNAD